MTPEDLADALVDLQAWADHESDRADQAEAALARVRALCDDAERNMTETQRSLPTCYVDIPSNKVRAAIDGPDVRR